jgi:hypothetical protein
MFPSVKDFRISFARSRDMQKKALFSFHVAESAPEICEKSRSAFAHSSAAPDMPSPPGYSAPRFNVIGQRSRVMYVFAVAKGG